MHAGTPPWPQQNFDELAARIASDDPPRLCEEPRHLSSLVMGLLKKSPRERLDWSQVRH